MNITEDMIKGNVVFHCDTEEKANELLVKLDELDYMWSSGESYLNYNCYSMYKENTCYHPYVDCYNDVSSCKNENYKIIEYVLDEYELDEPSTLKRAILERTLCVSLEDYDFYKNISFDEMRKLCAELAYIVEKDQKIWRKERKNIVENLGLDNAEEDY